jgi:hypothetical protein
MHKFCLENVRPNGLIANLDSVLSNIKDNDFLWSILDFDGIGPFPNAMSIDEFCEQITKQDRGYLCSWNEIVDFSKSIYDCYDCLIVAVKSAGNINKIEISNKNYVNCMLVLELFDSTYWDIYIKDIDIVDDTRWHFY